jgi:hypothetical protein
MIPVQVADEYRVQLVRRHADLDQPSGSTVAHVDKNVLSPCDKQVRWLRPRRTGHRARARSQRYPATQVGRLGRPVAHLLVVVGEDRLSG